MFARRQRSLKNPLVDFSVFTIPAFSAGVLSAAMGMFALAGLELATTQKFQLVENYTPLGAGVLVSVLAVSALPSALLAGALLHRVGLRFLIVPGFACTTIGTAVIMVGSMISVPLLVGSCVNWGGYWGSNGGGVYRHCGECFCPTRRNGVLTGRGFL